MRAQVVQNTAHIIRMQPTLYVILNCLWSGVSAGRCSLHMQAIGKLSSAYTSGWLIARVGARPALGLMAFFPLLMCFTSGLIREERQPYAAPAKAERLPSDDGPSGWACHDLYGRLFSAQMMYPARPFTTLL